MSGIFALERIAFQKDDFVADAEAIISAIQLEIIQNKTTAFNGDKLVVKFEKLIFERFGIKVDIETESALEAAIIPLYVNKLHIYANKTIQDFIKIADQERFMKKLDGKRGHVDPTTARVSGAYCEYKHKLFLNFHTLIHRFAMTPGEVCAIALHEIGHAFDALYMENRFDQTNQVMANAFRELQTKKAGTVSAVVTDITKRVPEIKTEDMDKLLNGTVVERTEQLVRATIEANKSLLKHAGYNRTSFEEGADAFSSRFGKGKDLAIALSKGPAMKSERSMSAYAISFIGRALFQAGSFMLLLASIAAIPTAAAAAVFPLVCAAVTFGSIGAADVWLTTEAGKVNYPYDTLKQRFIRIRQQAIELFKDKDFSKEDAASVLQDIAAIDDLINTTKEVKHLSAIVGNFLFKSSREAVKSREMQQMLETLLSNEMFVHSTFFNQKA